MVRRSNEFTESRKENAFGGSGYLLSRPFIKSPDDIWGKGRVFSLITLEENCEVGWHIHENDGELYCILEGEGEFNDNGTPVTLHPGDVSYTRPGEGHSLKNLHKDPLRFIALILYK